MEPLNTITITGTQTMGYTMDLDSAGGNISIRDVLEMLGASINTFVAEGMEEEVKPTALRFVLAQILGTTEARVVEILEFGVGESE